MGKKQKQIKRNKYGERKTKLEKKGKRQFTVETRKEDRNLKKKKERQREVKITSTSMKMAEEE